MHCQVDVVLQLKGLNQVGIPDQAVVRNADILELLHHLDEHSRESALRSPAPEVGRSLHGISRQPWHPPRKACPPKQCVHRPVIVITLREVHASKGPTRFLYGPHGKRLLLWQVDAFLQPKGHTRCRAESRPQDDRRHGQKRSQ